VSSKCLPLLFLAATLPAASPIRVFVTDSESWTSGGGARGQSVEVMKTFAERKECPGITITLNREKADYIVLFDHLGGMGPARKDNKIAVFHDDELLYSGSTRALGNAVKDDCKAILGEKDGR
jgi:hypothetical protein